MADQSSDIPAGAIPEDEYPGSTQGSAQVAQPGYIPPGAIPEDQFNQTQFGSGTEMAKTAIEQGLSGLTGGLSKVAETKFLGVPPENIAGREKENPITSTLSNIAGTGALLTATGGLGGLLPEGAGALARIGTSGLEGSSLGGVNQVTDDWSQNKSLDGQKIAASAGLGALLGTAGGALGEYLKGKSSLTNVPSAVTAQAEGAAEDAASAASPPVDAPRTGIQPTSFGQMQSRIETAKSNGKAIKLPAQAELGDAASRIEMHNSVTPLQADSLSSQTARDIYSTGKETPGDLGDTLNNYEGAQKGELVDKTEQAISGLSPGAEPLEDAYQGGLKAIQAFTDQYQTEKDALSPIFQKIKELPVQGDLLPDAVQKMSEAVPGVANMFDLSGGDIGIRPYKTAWGIDKATYSAVKEAVDGLTGEDNNLQTLWNVRKGLDQHVDVLSQGQAPREIRTLKAALMTQMQDATGDPNIREAFRRYAINEQERQVIERNFGASVGSDEFGQISQVKPEYVGDKIFSNTATVQAAKNILPKEQFSQILANYLAENKAAVTDKGSFSSNKWGSFLRRNQDALNIAFQDNPQDLQRFKDLTTIMRILPDAPSINPPRTASTLARILSGNVDVHNITWEGLMASFPRKIATEIQGKLKMNELNQYLSGQSLKNSQTQSLKQRVGDFSDQLGTGVQRLFSSGSAESRKAQ